MDVCDCSTNLLYIIGGIGIIGWILMESISRFTRLRSKVTNLEDENWQLAGHVHTLEHTVTTRLDELKVLKEEMDNFQRVQRLEHMQERVDQFTQALREARKEFRRFEACGGDIGCLNSPKEDALSEDIRTKSSRNTSDRYWLRSASLVQEIGPRSYNQYGRCHSEQPTFSHRSCKKRY